jgi:hypothetical protein
MVMTSHGIPQVSRDCMMLLQFAKGRKLSHERR